MGKNGFQGGGKVQGLLHDHYGRLFAITAMCAHTKVNRSLKKQRPDSRMIKFGGTGGRGPKRRVVTGTVRKEVGNRKSYWEQH